MTSTVTEDGRVTIPKPIRELLGLQPGSAVDFRRNDKGEIVIVAASGERSSFFSQFVGHAGPGMTTDEVMALTRGDD
ncbi:AbrB/MazE/SpoVT family DNA-binding domain-containing protein [Devosia elaeis]|uniref:AbrB family transcriptional regulator n=1 Tax=Devosia elaeis TaxID=1770058 RepID=A0A178HMI1_9HYPH|nr:AbrB/MazE/SpoVT family DNA-binding domain-containing protein [Devosia elaeis]OAM73947.1 AbrB family transcriptional regulator [Devosia elaeis]